MNNMISANYAVGYSNSYIQSIYTQRSTKSVMSADKTESAPAVEELSEEEKLEAFKKEIWDEINSYPWNPSISESIQITDGAFQRMMEDPDFKDRMLSVIYEDAVVARPPICAGVTWIDENGYSGYSYNDKAAGEMAFKAHSNDKDSFYVKKAAKKQDYLELWEERRLQQELQQKEQAEEALKAEWQNRALNEEAAEKKQEYSEQLQLANNGKQMSQASSSYEANIMTETAAGNVSLLG